MHNSKWNFDLMPKYDGCGSWRQEVVIHTAKARVITLKNKNKVAANTEVHRISQARSKRTNRRWKEDFRISKATDFSFTTPEISQLTLMSCHSPRQKLGLPYKPQEQGRLIQNPLQKDSFPEKALALNQTLAARTFWKIKEPSKRLLFKAEPAAPSRLRKQIPVMERIIPEKQ